MKIFKKVSAVILTVAFVCAVSGVYAQPIFNATISLSSDSSKSNTAVLSFNEKFDVYLKLKTGTNYYAGPFSVQVFYTNSTFKCTSAEFNKSGKLYATAKSYSNASPSSAMTQSGKSRFYPSGWSTTQISKYDFCNITMVPNSADAKTAVANLNEVIATVHLNAGTNTGTGTVFVSADGVKSTANAIGETYLSCFTDDGKILSTRYDYGTDASLDLSSASLNFTVLDVGDVNNDKALNSTDALIMLQYVTGTRTLTGDTLKKSDINNDSATNATDALNVLQIVTGLVHLNDIYKQ